MEPLTVDRTVVERNSYEVAYKDSEANGKGRQHLQFAQQRGCGHAQRMSGRAAMSQVAVSHDVSCKQGNKLA